MNSSFDPKKYLSRELLFICRVLSFVEPKANELMLDLKALSPEILLVTLKQHHIYPVFYTRWVLFQDRKELQTPEWNQFTDDLKTLVHSNRLQMLHKLKVLVEVTSALEKEGIPVIALKGPVLSKVIYGDFAMKSSLDLDILIDKTQTDEAMEVLKRMGFVLAKYNLDLNPSQKKYLKNHFHHLGFYHPEKKVQLELHWQLNTNKYLLDYTFKEMLESAIHVEVGANKIKTLDPCRKTICLMVHGAFHVWVRLDWLYDFSVARQKLLTDQQLINEAKKKDLLYPLCLSDYVFSLIFSTEQLKSLCSQKLKIKAFKYILTSIEYNNIADNSKPILRMRHKLYLMNFKPDMHYKIQVWRPLATNMQDWNDVKLPEKFFFLYYFIRPFLVIRNSLFGKATNS